MSVLDSLVDELEKIAEINTSGLSPQTMLETGAPPPPFETVGSAKAKAILDRVQTVKLATRVKNDPDHAYTHARGIVKPTLQGASAGLLLASLATKKDLHRHQRLIGAGTGAAVALGDHMYMNSKTHQKSVKTAMAMLTPAMRLKASREVGRARSGIHAHEGSVKLKSLLSGR